jgi:hypothetical protein
MQLAAMLLALTAFAAMQAPVWLANLAFFVTVAIGLGAVVVLVSRERLSGGQA